MDIDISDILADVSKPTPSSSLSFTHQQQQKQQSSHLDPSSSYTDHQLLVRAWTNERNSPSLLPYPIPLIQRITNRIQSQITKIEDLTSGLDFSSANNHPPPSYSNNNNNASKPSNNTNLILSIIQTDLSRTQFLLRSYLRQRLDKITKNAGWFSKFHTSTSPSIDSTDTTLLSPSETQFLQHHQSLLSEFYDSSFLSSFPANLRRLDDSAGGVNMVEPPDGGMGVVVRCLREEWGNEGEIGRLGESVGEEEGADVELRFRRGEVWVVRWRDVRRGVVDGDLECL